MARALVTGASTGLGRATAEALAVSGHEVVAHARAPGRFADPAFGTRMHALVFADLADPEQTLHLGEELAALGPMDVVIHNAGVFTGPDILAVNVVAPYILSAIMPVPARMIVLSSSMHRAGSTDLAGLDLTDATTRRRPYEDSKLCATTLAMALARLSPRCLVHAVDPGWVPTRMGGPTASDDLAEGHRTQHWLATVEAGRITPRTGGYWYHHAVQDPHPAVRDERFQDELLELLHAHTGRAPAGVDIPQS
ncbi:MAG: SDR family NAD(P)-dependent oxidoreductase [Actinomycetales bacterium]